ncbi:metal-dependent hydrolase [Streptomonospora sp. S1-112]|uniref:Metal-dependent hydrolase n=2 Tax=Streptomonospora mangrovi TaxID=2883123 RepID=A0A9X3NMI1_9ACTN|nr:metal-dependent hydrolase [Streptomonospora mangrovi]MDA0565705.1 metal-dependent hydrolase [Streptomonospora mangrovi]
MAPAHAATGLLAGVLATGAVSPFMAVGPLEVAAGAAIGAGSALLPDLDHPGSTAARAHGPLTGWLSRGARWASREVYYRTLTPADAPADGAHRFLWHTPAAALAVGLAMGAGAALSAWVLAGVLWFTIGLGVLGLAQVLPRRRPRGPARLLVPRGLGRLRRTLTRWPVVTAASGAGTALLLYAGASPGAWVGAVVGAGMATGVLGDALTRSAVPLAWPVQVGGRRWAMVGLPRRVRFATGTWPEHVIGWGCLLAAPLVGAALV